MPPNCAVGLETNVNNSWSIDTAQIQIALTKFITRIKTFTTKSFLFTYSDQVCKRRVVEQDWTIPNECYALFILFMWAYTAGKDCVNATIATCTQ